MSQLGEQSFFTLIDRGQGFIGGDFQHLGARLFTTSVQGVGLSLLDEGMPHWSSYFFQLTPSLSLASLQASMNYKIFTITYIWLHGQRYKNALNNINAVILQFRRWHCLFRRRQGQDWKNCSQWNIFQPGTRGTKTQNFPDSNFPRAKTFRMIPKVSWFFQLRKKQVFLTQKPLFFIYFSPFWSTLWPFWSLFNTQTPF